MTEKFFLRNSLHNAFISVENDRYLKLLLILAPLLNFLSGITFDLHAPSLPAIATYYNATISSVKNTITISLLGFSIGCILFGTLLDVFGRRPVIFSGLLVYTIASFLALSCGTIDELLFVRFMQGFAVSCLSIGCRTIIIDHFTGHQFKVALLYTSLTFGIGPILAPFIGGFLQYHLGWKANFIAYGVVSFILMIIFALFINESRNKNLEKFSFKNILINYINALKNSSFLPGTMIAGISQVQLLVYTTSGAFLIENILHRSAIVYGNSALVISCGYLFGTITNRFLIKHFQISKLISIGFLLLLFAIIAQIVFSLVGQLNLFTIILPITIIGFSNGFIFINILTCCLRLSSKAAGTATALFTSAVMGIGTLGTDVVSHINVNNLTHLTVIFGTSAIIQFVIFILFFRKIANKLN